MNDNFKQCQGSLDVVAQKITDANPQAGEMSDVQLAAAHHLSNGAIDLMRSSSLPTAVQNAVHDDAHELMQLAINGIKPSTQFDSTLENILAEANKEPGMKAEGLKFAQVNDGERNVGVFLGRLDSRGKFEPVDEISGKGSFSCIGDMAKS
jgi:hypothetical protein